MKRWRSGLFWVPLLALLPASLPGFQLQNQMERGLEDYYARLRLNHAFINGVDSIRLALNTEWRSGFRNYNRDSRRLLEQLSANGSHGMRGPWTLRWIANQNLFNERRSLRETLGSTLDLGARRSGALDVELLGGWQQDRRQTGFDNGPRLQLNLGAKYPGTDWTLGGRGSVAVQNPGERHNHQLAGSLDATWNGPATVRNDARLSLRRVQEDAIPDPVREVLERRRGMNLDFANLLVTPAGRNGGFRLDLNAWTREDDRRPQGIADTLRDTRGNSQDRGIAVRWEQGQRFGEFEARLGADYRRQHQESEYGPMRRISRTLSRIALNRLDAMLLWRPREDSLLARGATELRRRDTDFEGTVRDPDYMDQARRELLLRWSRFHGPGRHLGVEAGLTLNAERHMQASRSRSNHMNRTWRAAADHRLWFGTWRLRGNGVLVADYRLFDFDDPEQPHSWIQRRLQWEERLRKPLSGWVRAPFGGDALSLEAGARWMEEDGGSFHRMDGRERISDSARELRVNSALEWLRSRWSLRPGWSWMTREDWRWSAPSGTRERRFARKMQRVGPLFSVVYQSPAQRLLLDANWESVTDRVATGSTLHRRDLWMRLEWSLLIP